MKRIIGMALLTLLPLSLVAKSLSMHQSPSEKAPVITTIQSGDELITIFAPKDSDWLKVADPRNGKVGWLKKSDLNFSDKRYQRLQDRNQKRPMYHKTFKKKLKDPSGKVTGQQHMEFYGTQDIDQKQFDRMVKDMQHQHDTMIQEMERMIDRMHHWPSFGPRTDRKHPRMQPHIRRRPDRIIVPSDTTNNSAHIR